MGEGKGANSCPQSGGCRSDEAWTQIRSRRALSWKVSCGYDAGWCPLCDESGTTYRMRQGSAEELPLAVGRPLNNTSVTHMCCHVCCRSQTDPMGQAAGHWSGQTDPDWIAFREVRRISCPAHIQQACVHRCALGIRQ